MTTTDVKTADAADAAAQQDERTLTIGAGVAVAAVAGAFAAFGLPGLVIVKLGMAAVGLAMVLLITRG